MIIETGMALGRIYIKLVTSGGKMSDFSTL
jgi:hypothetical protein